MKRTAVALWFLGVVVMVAVAAVAVYRGTVKHGIWGWGAHQIEVTP